MVKLQILRNENHKYILQDKNGKKYIVYFNFYDVDKPESGDYIYIHEELLNPKHEYYSTHYIFGDLKNKYGRNMENIEDIDIIKLKKYNLEIYLKRLYG